MVLVLGDLIADLVMRIPHFPLRAKDLPKLEYIEVGPGGATNIAIMAARFGLRVGCLGEIGTDHFGAVVLEGLRREKVDVRSIVLNPQARTPVAGVIVDAEGEPAYLGYPGKLDLRRLPDAWRAQVRTADALFADGWVEYEQAAEMILDAFRSAREAGVPVFFDPGPGNPAMDNAWHRRAAALATVVLANEEEAARLTGQPDVRGAGRDLVKNGAALVVIKRAAEGALLMTAEQESDAPGFRVPLRDATGAGDSVTGAVIYGFVTELELADMGTLLNATGAAKVQKLGTGHHMPTREEILAVLQQRPDAARSLTVALNAL